MVEKYLDYLYEKQIGINPNREKNDIQIHKKIRKNSDNILNSANQLSI